MKAAREINSTLLESMRAEILGCINSPAALEKLYRENKIVFTPAFNQLYPEISEIIIAQVWRERLATDDEAISWGSRGELVFVIIVAAIAGLIAKIPDLFDRDPEKFYTRNIAFVVFPMLTAYFAWKHALQLKKLVIIMLAILISAVYINMLPNDTKSDTLILACIHLPIFLWALLGFAFVNENSSNNVQRLAFLRFNGDLVVMTTVMLIAGGLLTGITLGLFEMIGIRIETFYFKYIGIFGLSAAPIVAAYLVRTNPHLVNKVSPVIAKVFTPLVLVMLVVYLVAVIATGRDPYNDRQFLLIFNLLLIGVMAIILFSVAETSKNTRSRISTVLLFSLSIATIIVNAIALSAILFRISEWGITPNRLGVLGGNVLILTNLLIVSFRLFNLIRNSDRMEWVENAIASFLPIYVLWTVVVVFIFPMLFRFS